MMQSAPICHGVNPWLAVKTCQMSAPSADAGHPFVLLAQTSQYYDTPVFTASEKAD
jgi:hypothetical protein